jgi:hypothetical protein
MEEDNKKQKQQQLLLTVKSTRRNRQLSLLKLLFEAEHAIQVVAARAVDIPQKYHSIGTSRAFC